MVQDMRGLTQYIADLRACRIRELEEKRINKEMAHIRAKFKDGNLDGRQKKKYVAKILFTYILGYPVHIGHMESVNLVASSKYSEKQIGYLALTIMMHEDSDMIRMIINSIRKDLLATDEVATCIALHAIANIGSAEMAEALCEDVHKLLISPTSSPFVQKKAALTLLRLYRKNPGVVPAEAWALRLVSLMGDQQLGVALAVTTLVTTLAQRHTAAYAVAYPKAVTLLSRIVLSDRFPAEYIYYSVPIPWLQVKLLRLLQYFPPDAAPDEAIAASLRHTLTHIISSSQKIHRHPQHNNAQNAVLCEAINLAIHLDAGSEAVAAAIPLLGRFLRAKETNIRYLGLDTMTHLALRSQQLGPLQKHLDTAVLALRDRDISVRRRALDLLYAMCDTRHARDVVGRLLKYLAVAEFTLREELALRIAILTERFATDYEWYVDTVLQLIALAGDYVGDAVGYRVLQIVTNTTELQAYAARRVCTYLAAPTCHENLVKIGAYILGEYGDLIADDEDRAPLAQLSLVHAHTARCTPPTRALILTTYFKWVNLFPEIHRQLLIILHKFTRALDPEIQQRACEYLAVARLPSDALLQVLADEMPPYPERESTLVSSLLARSTAPQGDLRTWHIGGPDKTKGGDKRVAQVALHEAVASREREDATGALSLGAAYAASPSLRTPSGASGFAQLGTSAPNTPALGSPNPASANTLNANLLDLEGLYIGNDAKPRANSDAPKPRANSLLSTDARPKPRANSLLAPVSPAKANVNKDVPHLPVVTEGGSAAPATTSALAPSATGASAALPPAPRLVERLIYASEGVLYEDSQLQIGVKTHYDGARGSLTLFYGNKLDVSLNSFTTTLMNDVADAVTVRSLATVPSLVASKKQVTQHFDVECLRFFDRTPALHVSYLAGSLQTVVVALPVVITKFITPTTIDKATFFERWRQIGGPPRERQKIFPVGPLDTKRNRKIMAGVNLGILDGLEGNVNNLVCAGVVNMTSRGKVGCLVRYEPNPELKMARLTIRTTDEHVSTDVLNILQRAFQKRN